MLMPNRTFHPMLASSSSDKREHGSPLKAPPIITFDATIPLASIAKAALAMGCLLVNDRHGNIVIKPQVQGVSTQ
jgi:hypothetical protein